MGQRRGEDEGGGDRFRIALIDEFFRNYDGLIPPVTEPPNPNFGEPREIVPNSQRRYQIGARIEF